MVYLVLGRRRYFLYWWRSGPPHFTMAGPAATAADKDGPSLRHGRARRLRPDLWCGGGRPRERVLIPTGADFAKEAKRHAPQPVDPPSRSPPGCAPRRARARVAPGGGSCRAQRRTPPPPFLELAPYFAGALLLRPRGDDARAARRARAAPGPVSFKTAPSARPPQQGQAIRERRRRKEELTSQPRRDGRPDADCCRSLRIPPGHCRGDGSNCLYSDDTRCTEDPRSRSLAPPACPTRR